MLLHGITSINRPPKHLRTHTFCLLEKSYTTQCNMSNYHHRHSFPDLNGVFVSDLFLKEWTWIDHITDLRRSNSSWSCQTRDRFNGFFNWTMTYRLDSDISSPYGTLVPKKVGFTHLHTHTHTTRLNLRNSWPRSQKSSALWPIAQVPGLGNVKIKALESFWTFGQLHFAQLTTCFMVFFDLPSDHHRSFTIT